MWINRGKAGDKAVFLVDKYAQNAVINITKVLREDIRMLYFNKGEPMNGEKSDNAVTADFKILIIFCLIFKRFWTD